MTSSPGPAPSASMARCRAVPQLLVVSACAVPATLANRSSNAAQVGPAPDSQPDAKTAATASSSSCPTVGWPSGMTSGDDMRLLCPLGDDLRAAGLLAGQPLQLGQVFREHGVQGEVLVDQRHPGLGQVPGAVDVGEHL